MEKSYMIVNMDLTYEDRFGNIRIEPKARPSFIHTDKGKAEDELLRLKKQRDSGEFVLFEAVAVAQAQVTNTGIFEINKIEK